MDREKVIKGLEYCEEYFNCCDKCPYWDGGTHCAANLAHDALALLKEDCHNCKLECLLQKYDELKEKYDKLLKEQNWIKCSDEMPEERDSIFAKLKGTDKWSSAMFEKMSEDVRVVVVFEDGTRRVHHSYTVDGKWDVEKKPPKRTVTHWMPNPKLPKEGS